MSLLLFGIALGLPNIVSAVPACAGAPTPPPRSETDHRFFCEDVRVSLSYREERFREAANLRESDRVTLTALVVNDRPVSPAVFERAQDAFRAFPFIERVEGRCVAPLVRDCSDERLRGLCGPTRVTLWLIGLKWDDWEARIEGRLEERPVNSTYVLTLSPDGGLETEPPNGVGGAVADDPPGLAEQAPERVTITSGPHWRPALMASERELYRCPGTDRIVAEFDVQWTAQPRTSSRRRLTQLRVNDAPVSDRTVAEINAALDSFDSDPFFRPHCFSGRFQVHIYQVQDGRSVGSRYVDVIL